MATAPFNTAWQGYTFWRNRWTIENSGFRELKEGWHLEEALWTFRNTVVAAARLTFTLIAYNVAQIAKSKVAERLKARGIRKLRQELNRQFGFRSSPVIVFAAGAFTILHLEELVVLLGGKPPQFSFGRPGGDMTHYLNLSSRGAAAGWSRGGVLRSQCDAAALRGSISLPRCGSGTLAI